MPRKQVDTAWYADRLQLNTRPRLNMEASTSTQDVHETAGKLPFSLMSNQPAPLPLAFVYQREKWHTSTTFMPFGKAKNKHDVSPTTLHALNNRASVGRLAIFPFL